MYIHLARFQRNEKEIFMEKLIVDIIIPVYRPNKTFRLLLRKLQEQTFVVHKVIIANTEKRYWEEFIGRREGAASLENLPFELEVFHVEKKDFDHGGTRRLAVERSRAEYFICMTQDAVPADKHLVEQLIKPFCEGQAPGSGTAGNCQGGVAASYARQLPGPDCNPVEVYTRSFNYPAKDRLQSKEDLDRLGIKTFFCSDVCAAYRRDIWDALGGFEEHTIFNEDMIYAGHAVLAGYGIAYAAGAQVIHSHNYTGRQQYHRNFDLAVSQQQHPEVFYVVKSESEGIRMVKNTAKYLLTSGKPWLIMNLVWQSAFKYLGYRAGRNYERMKKRKILKATMNPEYWHSLWQRTEAQEKL